jgi:prepilin-type processing-associated H-X9-DG protein
MFSSNNFDGFHGIYGQQVGFGYCGGWVGYDYSYFGFQPRHRGGKDTCDTTTRATDYKVGQTIVAFADGHAKALEPGQLLKPDATNTKLQYWSPN